MGSFVQPSLSAPVRRYFPFAVFTHRPRRFLRAFVPVPFSTTDTAEWVHLAKNKSVQLFAAADGWVPDNHVLSISLISPGKSSIVGIRNRGLSRNANRSGSAFFSPVSFFGSTLYRCRLPDSFNFRLATRLRARWWADRHRGQTGWLFTIFEYSSQEPHPDLHNHNFKSNCPSCSWQWANLLPPEPL